MCNESNIHLQKLKKSTNRDLTHMLLHQIFRILNTSWVLYGITFRFYSFNSLKLIIVAQSGITSRCVPSENISVALIGVFVHILLVWSAYPLLTVFRPLQSWISNATMTMSLYLWVNLIHGRRYTNVYAIKCFPVMFPPGISPESSVTWLPTITSYVPPHLVNYLGIKHGIFFV